MAIRTEDVTGAVALDTWDDVNRVVENMTTQESDMALMYFTEAMMNRVKLSPNDPHTALYCMRDALQYVHGRQSAASE